MPVALVVVAFIVPGASSAGANNSNCAAQFVTQFAGPGFGADVSSEASTFGRAFGQETKSFGTAPHNTRPT
jgi:hypothetical protein